MVRHTGNHHEPARIPLHDRGGRSSGRGRGRRAGRRTAWSHSCSCSSPAWSPRSCSCADRSRRSRGRSRSPGSTGEVEVIRDDHGIPQLYADTTADLMAAQGYVHAQERFYEMDFRRHVTAGRLSELFGADTLEIDTFIRTLGWRRVAEQELPLLAAARRARRWTPTPRASTPTSTRTARRRSPSSTPCSASAGSTTGPSRGPRSTRWPGSRRWRGTCKGNLDEEIERALVSADHTPEQVAELYPATTTTRPTGRSSARAPSSTGSSSRTRRGRYPQPGAAGVHRRSARAARRACTRGRWSGCPQLLGHGLTGGAATAGSSTASTPRPARRCWPTTRTSASACRASGCRWGCTAAPSATTARSTSPGSRSRACRA